MSTNITNILTTHTLSQSTSSDDDVHASADTPASASASIFAVDNPCWGSPTSCSLEDLLKLVDKQQSILFENKDFLVLEKPPDLRMDGNYPATVHKLLTYWYPPPSLRQQQQEPHHEVQPQRQSQADDNNWILQRVSSLHRHSDTHDNELRPCHQLDYATSGVLLVARNKEAAGKAQLAFEHRQVQKTYAAVLVGHISIPKTTTTTTSDTTTDSEALHCAWPILTRETLQRTLKQMEDSYRKRRHNCRKDTWNGYLPVHSLFQQWQQQKRPQRTKRLNTTTQPKAKKAKTTQKKDVNKLTDAEWDQVWAEIDNLSDIVNEEARTGKWKELRKSKGSSVVCKFERAAEIYNRLMRDKSKGLQDNENSSSNKLFALPTFFCVADDWKSSNSRDDEGTETFYVAAPLAQVDDDFAMRIYIPQLVITVRIYRSVLPI